MAAPSSQRTRTTIRTAVVWDYLRDALDRLDRHGSADRIATADSASTADSAGTIDSADTAGAGRSGSHDGRLRVLDAGGGSGGFAVPLAQLGHDVTVVDPSPDSLAALERRVAEAGVAGGVRALQGDAAGLADLVPAGAFDLVLCHSVLEVVDDPPAAVHAIAAALRPGGVASVLAANRPAAVLARVTAGRLGEARRLLADPAGSAGDNDPLTRRFTLDELQRLLVAGGLRPRTVHGVRVFTDAVPPAVLDGDPAATDDLLALERAAAEDAAFLGVATQLHVVADRA